jgi:hypothetical protein
MLKQNGNWLRWKQRNCGGESVKKGYWYSKITILLEGTMKDYECIVNYIVNPAEDRMY